MTRGRAGIDVPNDGSSRLLASDVRPALVLSGGGILGAVQVGVLKALFRGGLRPSMVVGTSVGALNGAFVAFQPDLAGVSELEAVWRDLRASRIFEQNPVRLAVNLITRRNCMFRTDLLQQLIGDSLVTDDFAAAQIPLRVVATDMTRGEKVVLEEGPVSEAVLASCAIPGLFCPVESGGVMLVDGGLVANMDLETAVNAGASDILAIDLTQPPDGFKSDSIVKVLYRSLELLLQQQVKRDIERFSDRARITVIRPHLDHAHTLASFGHIGHLIEEGERLGRQLLEECVDDEGHLSCGLVTNEPGSTR
ncbi:MAG: patatin-like phospholipase family protein [Chloroflexi bacterium]|nr:patatin-like phospholipase family protein [Chloroflexota bacterium]